MCIRDSPMVARITNKIHITNPFLPQIKEQYPALFSVLILASATFENNFGVHLSDDEISFLLIHVQASIERLNPVSYTHLAGFMFGFVERLTIPFGMNHVWWPTFWLQAGEYVNQAGQVVNGDQLIFFAQLADNVPLTAGTFMNGLFVLKMFSMPAAAFAMYKCARPENRKKVAGIMLSGAITSFVCGITEPLEFCFIFAAPVLFLCLIHISAS